MSDGLPPSMTDLLGPLAQPERSVLTEQPSRQVQFLTTGVSPPSDLYISPDDSIRVEAYTRTAGIPIQIRFRFITPAGELQYEEELLTTVGLPAIAQQDFRQGEGFLLSVAAVVPSMPLMRGTVYVTISYIRAFGGPSASYQHTLVQGYITQTTRVSWPVIQTEQSTSGQGHLLNFAVGTQPNGATFTYNVPANLRMRLRYAFINLQTSATVANRFVYVSITSPAASQFLVACPNAQTAGQTTDYTLGEGLPFTPAPSNYQTIPLPLACLIPPSGTLNFGAVGMQPTDYFTLVTMMFEEWIDQ